MDVIVKHRVTSIIFTIKILPRAKENEYFRSLDKIVNEHRIAGEAAERESKEKPYVGDLMEKMEENLMKQTVLNPIPESGSFTDTYPGAVIRLLFRKIIPIIHQWPLIDYNAPLEEMIPQGIGETPQPQVPPENKSPE